MPGDGVRDTKDRPEAWRVALLPTFINIIAYRMREKILGQIKESKLIPDA